MALTETGYTNGEAAGLLAGLVSCRPEDICRAIVLVMTHNGRIRLGCDMDEKTAECLMAMVLEQRGWTVALKVSGS